MFVIRETRQASKARLYTDKILQYGGSTVDIPEQRVSSHKALIYIFLQALFKCILSHTL